MIAAPVVPSVAVQVAAFHHATRPSAEMVAQYRDPDVVVVRGQVAAFIASTRPVLDDLGQKQGELINMVDRLEAEAHTRE